MLNNRIFIISAPSGVGKSTLIKELLKTKKNFKKLISYTTRKIRAGEENSKHYYFISKYKFKNMIKKHDFIEYAKVFGNYYGITYKNIEYLLSLGNDIILDIDWQGAREIRKKMPKITTSIFILPPSKKELYNRLVKRAKDSDITIKKRLLESIKEIIHYIEYDYLIINDIFSQTLFDLKSIIYVEKLKIKYQKFKFQSLINKLIKS